jgi:uncharacterized protein (DUF2147 family)
MSRGAGAGHPLAQSPHREDLTMAWRKLVAPAWIVAALLFGLPAHADDIAGTWLSQSGETRVRFSPCGGIFCGVIVWVSKPGKDVNNPDESKRERSLVGIQMVTMKPQGGGSYSGHLYNYQDGKTYSGKAKVTGAGLELSGCVLGGLICRSQVWKRVD